MMERVAHEKFIHTEVLSEATTRKVIVGMLMMLMLLPYTTMTTMDKSQMFGLKLLFNYGSAECSDIASQEVRIRPGSSRT